MSDSVHRAIWYIRTKRGIYISRFVERYIVEELEEDFFPYGFEDGSDATVLEYVWDFIQRYNAGEINILKPREERILERYEALKEEHYCLLAEINRLMLGAVNEDWDDDLPF